MAAPGMVLVPLLINTLHTRTNLLRNHPRAAAPLQVKLHFSKNILRIVVYNISIRWRCAAWRSPCPRRSAAPSSSSAPPSAWRGSSRRYRAGPRTAPCSTTTRGSRGGHKHIYMFEVCLIVNIYLSKCQSKSTKETNEQTKVLLELRCQLWICMCDCVLSSIASIIRTFVWICQEMRCHEDMHNII